VVTEVQKTVLPSNPLIQGIQAAQHLSTLERFFQTFGLTLSEKDYSRPTSSVDKRPAKEPRIDWGEAVDASIFYGRTSELETLEKWIVSDRCRLVALLGMGGIGKTSLAAKLGEKVQYEFDYVVWRSYGVW
jgi:NB-ARC domain